jgi:hypothetical protein
MATQIVCVVNLNRRVGRMLDQITILRRLKSDTRFQRDTDGISGRQRSLAAISPG